MIVLCRGRCLIHEQKEGEQSPTISDLEVNMAVLNPTNSKNFLYRFMAAGKIKTGSCHTANKAYAVKFKARMK